MAEQEFKVVREHFGDRFYKVGETRTADAGSVKHLVPHVLEPAKAKADPKVKNKAEDGAPKNKDDGQ